MNDFYAEWAKVCQQQEIEQNEWVDYVKSKGYDMAMPNDGWVDREKLTLSLAYPYYCSSDFGVGSDAIIGFYNKPQEAKAIRIISFIRGILGSERFGFEYIDLK